MRYHPSVLLILPAIAMAASGKDPAKSLPKKRKAKRDVFAPLGVVSELTGEIEIHNTDENAMTSVPAPSSPEPTYSKCLTDLMCMYSPSDLN